MDRGRRRGEGLCVCAGFSGLEAIVRNRWRTALLLAGAAGAFHVLVGGWTAVAIGLAWLFGGRERPTLKTLAPAAVLGLLLHCRASFPRWH